MSSDLFIQFVALFFTGIGLLLVGGVNLLLPRRTAGWARGLATVLIVGLVLAGAWACGGDLRAVGRAAGALALALGACLLAGSERLTAAGTTVLAVLRRPAGRWGLLALAGVALAMGSAASYEAQVEATLDGQMLELEALSVPPPTATLERARVVTDRGTAVEIREATAPRSEGDLRVLEERLLQTSSTRANVFRRQPADDRCNCHGWVFTGGRFWIGGVNIDLILGENGYQPVSDPRSGDLAVYRMNGSVSHTAVVRYVTDGMPVLVEGKWGCSGVFLHPVDKSIYGSDFTYYRSPRPGHLLAGINSPDDPNPAPTAPDDNPADAITE
ncbi:MAG: hypothetical protein JWO38_28 [Gemmataceae bacterium]|nr:hypothetical protein [Gemmataceae bacterium]